MIGLVSPRFCITCSFRFGHCMKSITVRTVLSVVIVVVAFCVPVTMRHPAGFRVTRGMNVVPV